MRDSPALSAPQSLAGRTALITGTAQGLGRALAQTFHDHGATVLLADVDADRNERVGAEIDPAGRRAHALAMDLRSAASIAAAFDAAVDRCGQVDVVVNNAAVTHMTSLWELAPEAWDDAIDVNLRGTFLLSRLAGARMRERGRGRIVNIASLAGQAPRPSGAHYAASKAGIVAITRAFAAELAPDGVTVNAVAPAIIDTPMVRAIGEEALERLTAAVPVKRICQPEEVARLAVYLASDEAGFVTGATYDINGGVLMR